MKKILLAAAFTTLVGTAWGQNSGGVGTGAGSVGTGTVTGTTSGTGAGSTGRPSTSNGSINGTNQYATPGAVQNEQMRTGTVNGVNTNNRAIEESRRRRATQYQDTTQPGAINNNGTTPVPRTNEAF